MSITKTTLGHLERALKEVEEALHEDLATALVTDDLTTRRDLRETGYRTAYALLQADVRVAIRLLQNH